MSTRFPSDRGIATEALRAVTGYAFATLDSGRLGAGVFDWNPAWGRGPFLEIEAAF